MPFSFGLIAPQFTDPRGRNAHAQSINRAGKKCEYLAGRSTAPPRPARYAHYPFHKGEEKM